MLATYTRCLDPKWDPKLVWSFFRRLVSLPRCKVLQNSRPCRLRRVDSLMCRRAETRQTAVRRSKLSTPRRCPRPCGPAADSPAAFLCSVVEWRQRRSSTRGMWAHHHPERPCVGVLAPGSVKIRPALWPSPVSKPQGNPRLISRRAPGVPMMGATARGPAGVRGPLPYGSFMLYIKRWLLVDRR